MDDRLTAETALRSAIEKLGTQAQLARLCQVSSTAVWKWVRSAKRLPPEFVLKVEAATGISRHDLRPDIYPIENLGSQPEAAPAAASEFSVAGDRTSPLAGARS